MSLGSPFENLLGKQYERVKIRYRKVQKNSQMTTNADFFETDGLDVRAT